MGTQYFKHPLDRHVLAVAGINHAAGDWSAYIGKISSIDYGDEWRDVKNHGSKLPRRVAEALFEQDLGSANEDRAEAGQEPLRWRN